MNLVTRLMDVKLEVKIVGMVVIALVIGAVSIGFISINFLKTDMYNLVDNYSKETTDYIRHSIETTMVSGNADVTAAMIEDRSGSRNVESIALLNAQGQRAFAMVKEGRPEDIAVANQIKKDKTIFTKKSKGINVYYMPLIKKSECVKCHSTPAKGEVIGIVKVSMSTKKAEELISKRSNFILMSLFIGVLLLGGALWLAFKKAVINPVKELQEATHSLAEGDFSFSTNISSKDEIGLLGNDIAKAIRGIGKIILRVGSVSKRVANVTVAVEKESYKVIEGTQLESDATDSILSSVEEFNKAAGEIAESVSGLSVSSEETAASVDEMVANTEEITKSSTELSAAVDSSSSSIEQMLASIKEIGHKTEELSIASEETLSAIEEINSAVKEIESNTREAAKLSEKVTTDASGFGMGSINKTSEGMERIKTSVQKTAEFIGKLGGRSEEIGKILNVIDEITDQTTLLALNAAILAAQAGEHGKGFSVVAEEIKDLAERTSFSTKEIDSLIQAVRAEVKGAVTTMADGLKTVEEGSSLTMEAREALKKIIESSKMATEMTSAVDDATSEQTKGIRFVTDSMEKIKDMVLQIANATSEQTRGTSQMIQSSEKISDIAKHVKNATIEQARGGKQIYKAVEDVSLRVHQISNALNSQKSGSDIILSSIEKIKDVPIENRNRAFKMNRNLRNLIKDTELLMTEMNRFNVEVLEEDKGKAVMYMGVVPLESPADMFRKFVPLVNYLSRKLNKKIELKVAVDFEETIKEIGEGLTSICYMTPSTYIETRKDYNIEVIAIALRKGKPFHRSVIVSREKSKISSVKDIKGQSFAFGDKRSTSSHIVPRHMLFEAGINIEDLSYYDYLGHHDDVAKAVLEGKFDAGGLMESTALKYKEQGLNIIEQSVDIPEFNICINRKLPEEDKTNLRQALMDLEIKDPDGKEILQSIDSGYTGFNDSFDKDYDGIREIMKKLGLL